MVEYDFDEEDSMLEGVDTAAVTPLVKEALVKKRRDELLQQRTWKMGVSSQGSEALGDDSGCLAVGW